MSPKYPNVWLPPSRSGERERILPFGHQIDEGVRRRGHLVNSCGEPPTVGTRQLVVGDDCVRVDVVDRVCVDHHSTTSSTSTPEADDRRDTGGGTDGGAVWRADHTPSDE